MEVFIRNLDARTTRDKLKTSLTPILEQFQIHVFDIRKTTGKTFASLTVADVKKAQSLLAHAQTNSRLLCSPSGRPACFHISKNQADTQALRALHKEEKDRQNVKAWQKAAQRRRAAEDAERHGDLTITALECGRWEITTGQPIFVPYFEVRGNGKLDRSGRALIIRINTAIEKEHELIMDLGSIYSMTVSREKSYSRLTISLTMAPKIFENDAFDFIARLTLTDTPTPSRFRDSTLPGLDSAIVGSCLTYSIHISYDFRKFKERVESLISHRIPVAITPSISQPSRKASFAEQRSRLAELQLKCSFKWRFQIHALWANGVLSPAEVQQLFPAMVKLRTQVGETALIEALRRLNSQSPLTDATSDPQQAGVRAASAAMTQYAHILQEDVQQKSLRDEVFVHRVTVTPTGMYLYGPEEIAANRILRLYRAHEDCFVRVLFADEDEGRIDFDRAYSNERIFKNRFLSMLRTGLDIAGEHFDFLGFSHSSLRSQTCWFMRPFVDNGSLLFARSLIAKLGDFSAIHCPAKCAARIGQAFSETYSAVPVDESSVFVMDDVKAGGYTFTDGCGTISESTWRLLKGNSTSKNQPTSYQIRYQGAKGVLSLDTRLQGHRIGLRDSMIKFKGSPSNDIEICNANARPLPYRLNRPIIKILEDLDVPAMVFEKLQEQAMQRLRLSATSSSFVSFVSDNLTDTSSGLPTLLNHLKHIGVDVTEDNFLRDVLGALIQVQLREIKYRSRIPVPNAVTLIGISDETGWLEEGQVFVTFASEDFSKHLHLNGQVAVTRSPALHPGDIQLVQAVVPPDESILWDLHNCIVFSQRGVRDLPSMLSGGDLDGDLYNIIHDEELMPKKNFMPAAYTPAKPLDIGRTVTADDMTEFFVDFMQNDQLGRLATLHQVFADVDGVMSDTCILLAELHSTAVDFSKSGVSVDINKIPRSPLYRPDFMAPSASTKVEKGVKRSVDTEISEGNQYYSYYESDRILGRLYRAVDEDHFFQNLENDTSSVFSANASDTVLGDILDWVQSRVSSERISTYISLAEDIRNHYELNMLELMSMYAVHRTEYLTEKEVFIGTILGKSGAGNRFQREQSDYMKRRFNKDLRDIKSWMQTKTDDDEDELLILAAACLYVAVQGKSKVKVQLNSFGWFAAGMCVPELVRNEEDVSDLY